MTSDGPAPRFAASSFPEIQGIRLMPGAAEATLVNLSSSGILVECSSRVLPGTVLTVEFSGGFSPESVEGRVIRCEVKGIAPEGTLRFHIGLAFTRPIALPGDRTALVAAPPRAAAPWPPAAAVTPASNAPAPTAPPAAAADPKAPTIPRNRW